MEIINQITETAKSWWIPIDQLQPGRLQDVFTLTDKGWVGRSTFYPERIEDGYWTISRKLGTVLYWMPIVTDLDGVEADKWMEEEEC